MVPVTWSKVVPTRWCPLVVLSDFVGGLKPRCFTIKIMHLRTKSVPIQKVANKISGHHLVGTTKNHVTATSEKSSSGHHLKPWCGHHVWRGDFAFVLLPVGFRLRILPISEVLFWWRGHLCWWRGRSRERTWHGHGHGHGHGHMWTCPYV